MARRLLAIVLGAALPLLGAAAARAQSELFIDGAGDGHGVGMSQDGAQGLASHGFTYQQILAHYYTGTSLGQLPAAANVTVALALGRSDVTFTGASLVDHRGTAPTANYRAVPSHGGRIELEGGVHHRRLAAFTSPLLIGGPGALLLRGTAMNGITDGLYSGSLELVRNGGRIDVVNVVPLESYLLGVVPAESPSSWLPAELEAQAIAARTYAITSHASGEFAVYADTRSQQYDGIGIETASTNAAVTATTGQIVTYNGAPVITYFSASSGGETENVQNVFLGTPAEPWLVSVLDPYDDGRWGALQFSLTSAARLLGPLLHGRLEAIRVTQRGVSPRVVSAHVVGSRGTTTVSGPQLEAAFGLQSTWACFDVTGPSGIPPTGWDAPCAGPTGAPAQGATGPSGASGSSGMYGTPGAGGPG